MIIKAENLQHIYKTAAGEKLALDNLNFSINIGEFVAIIGTNGSGNTRRLCKRCLGNSG
ncbi:MAG: hypothetical protein IJT73_07975 [Selenomonadaceae bacterium]|nr:hypothetical protein [Selenomonadaceae bacterium]